MRSFNSRLNDIEKRLPRADEGPLIINIVYVDHDENGAVTHSPSPPDWADAAMEPYVQAEHERNGGRTVVIEWSLEGELWHATIAKQGSWRVTPDGCEPLDETPLGHLTPRYWPSTPPGKTY